MVKFDNSSVDCRNFENRIQDLMDQRVNISNDRILKSHSVSCHECATTLASFQALEQALYASFDREKFNAPSRTTTIPVAASTWSIAAAVLAIAAVLTIIVLPVLNQDQNGVEVAQVEPSVGESTPSIKIPPPAPSVPTPIVNEVKSPLTPSINLVSYDLPTTLRNAYQYAAELPGIRPFECSLNATIEALQNSWNSSSEPQDQDDNPDLGTYDYIQQNGLA
jgi:hypothetical protein